MLAAAGLLLAYKVIFIDMRGVLPLAVGDLAMPDIYRYMLNYTVAYGEQYIRTPLDTIPIYIDRYAAILELKRYLPVWASEHAYVLKGGNTTEELYRILSSERFEPWKGVFVAEGEEVPGGASEWRAEYLNASSEPLNIEVEKAMIRAEEVIVELRVDRPCFAVLPLAYFEGLRVEVNGHVVKPFKALPGFIGLRLEAGRNEIRVRRVLTGLEYASYTISIATLVLSPLIMGGWFSPLVLPVRRRLRRLLSRAG